MSHILEPVKRHGGSEGDGISTVGCAMASFCWWGSALDGGLSTLLFSIWRFEVVDLKFFFFFFVEFMFSVSDLVVVLRVGHELGSQVLGK